MSDTKPQRRNSYIAEFSRDHHFGLLLVRKIRQGLEANIQADRIAAYIVYMFSEDLSQHFKEEEELLFVLLPESDELRKRAEDEHEEIYGLLDNFIFQSSNVSTLTTFADILDRHIRFEERELFNRIQENVDESELIKASEKMVKRSHTYDENWKDNFWVTK